MSSLSLKMLIEMNKLTGPNYLDWLRNLRIVLRQEKIEYVLDTVFPTVSTTDSIEYTSFDKDAYQKYLDDCTSAALFMMLSSMSMELQRQHENMGPNEMLEHLKSLYDSQSQTVEYELLIDIFKCKLNEGGQVSQHVLTMIGPIERLASIGTKLEKNVTTTLILNSLPRSFENFIVNFNMNGTKATLPELHNMLKTFESSTSKGKAMLMINMSINNSHSWVLDTTCGSHICTNVQGLTDSRKVGPMEVDLRVGNGARVDAERVGTYKLNLPSAIV
ncbi:hypothetical protein RND71_011882 [Anisodus tanguticus]|uniref:Uncharacterized protein n=1 Tax=Anisodus tanguticus TaxID=243964 RepID=A0AAE1SE47_9SOLA|nr:hypothetical protein RND71_011882 [Anisodus tanguticus]